MTWKWLVAGVLDFTALTACVAAVIGVVMGVNSVLHYTWPNPTMPGRLIYSLALPFGVVLFAMLVEQTGWITERFKFPGTTTSNSI